MSRLLSVLAAAFLFGCSDTTAPAGPAPSHTINQGGHWHMPGLRSPQGVCTTCHGADLQGGANGQPSCYSCHGKTWN
jgi:hypothetical protein